MGRQLFMVAVPVVLTLAACGGSGASEPQASTGGLADHELCEEPFSRFERAASLSVEQRTAERDDFDDQGFLMSGTVGHERLYGCLEPGETVIAIEGLPGVSGVFRSRDVRMELRGFGEVVLYEGSIEPDMQQGRCFVGRDDQPFQTNAVIHSSMRATNLYDHPAQSSVDPGDRVDQVSVEAALTVDVGITSGDPKTKVAAVTMHTRVDGDAMDLTHNYVPGPYRGPLIMDIDSNPQPTTDDNPWAGSVTVTSIFHNAADYTPYVPGDNRWTGQGIVDGRITIWCGG